MIISCGEALVDLVPHAVPGGGPMNVAIAATRLGVPGAFVGRVSTDAHGDQIWQHMQDNNVDLRAAQRGDEPTARAIVETEPILSFRFEGEGTADTCLVDVDLDVLGTGPALLHGGTLGLFRGDTAETIAQLAEAHQGIVSVDPNIRPPMITDRERWDHYHQRWLDRASIYKGSDEDIEWIWPGRDAASVAAELLAGGLGAFIITRGPEGAEIFCAQGHVVAPGTSVEVVDTVGAGDTFVAAMLSGLLQAGVTSRVALAELDTASWVAMGTRAGSAAAMTCSRQGADPPTVAELDAFIAAG